jgi:hypothetical protein
MRVLPLMDRFGLIARLGSSTSCVREEERDFSMSSSSVALEELCVKKVMGVAFGGFFRSFRRLAKQIHSDPRMMRRTKAPPPIAIPAIVAGFKLAASKLAGELTAGLLWDGSGGLLIWLLATGALKMGKVDVVNTGVLLVSKIGVVAALKVVVALIMAVMD